MQSADLFIGRIRTLVTMLGMHYRIASVRDASLQQARKHCGEMMNKSLGHGVPTLLAAAILLAFGNDAAAQDTTPPPSSNTSANTPDGGPAAAKSQNLETVVVTGTRSAGRTVNSSLTPIDVISADTLLQTGTTD